MTIRTATVDDIEAINDIYNHYVVNTAITFDYEPWSIEQRKTWFEKLANSDDYYHVLVKEDEAGDVIGFAYNSEFREKLAYRISSEITIYLRHDLKAKGLGSMLMQALLKQMANSPVKRAYSVITLPNDASLGLHRKFGFEQVGYLTDVGFKFDQYYSVAILEAAVSDF
ncbi:N-acetyltransferase family protein [Enterovibrio norvegicus]|uniref:GNAT family N-acetyltransferase n=1 Tax=Enterovibrio norvegicus TaxID=188144 RepID=UPI000C82E81F|nr:GNAT family N-acetyltransferase [Enterovibrio norvegicus]PMH72716.1 GNAT family N-acetyltransferase [Enterovibrio norvegicus]PMI31973.1 GNAT family N-acetyltransferase [Enterovibrio norvegicus]TKF15103.1 N-acetyltransferase family protein [Enterovibrio norvegicus]